MVATTVSVDALVYPRPRPSYAGARTFSIPFGDVFYPCMHSVYSNCIPTYPAEYCILSVSQMYPMICIICIPKSDTSNTSECFVFWCIRLYSGTHPEYTRIHLEYIQDTRNTHTHLYSRALAWIHPGYREAEEAEYVKSSVYPVVYRCILYVSWVASRT